LSGARFSKARILQQVRPTDKKDADMKNDFLFKAVTFKATARKALTFAAAFLLASAIYAQSDDSNPDQSTPGASKVRIVRLSQVKGVVQIDRNIGRGYENAIANLPVVEHSKIRTGVGIAEVEFEDNSSMRIAPNSLVEFPRLERAASGATASTVQVVQGTAYVSLVKPQDKKAPANALSSCSGLGRWIWIRPRMCGWKSLSRKPSLPCLRERFARMETMAA
jgi:hypothetical protein